MKENKKISRRLFLQQSTAAMCGFALAPIQILSNPFQLDENGLLGRVLFADVPTYDKPHLDGVRNGTQQFNDILPLMQPTRGSGEQRQHEIWYPISDKAFIQSQNIQVVRNVLNLPREDILKSGRLGEVTVPLTKAIPTDKQNSRSHQIFFYGSVHWVYGLGENTETKQRYYLVIEDRWNESYYVDATHMRIIEDEELAPLSPEVAREEKRILVDTRNQMLFAYEGEILMMACGVSTGQFSNGRNLSTPPGEYVINYKRPTRHMVHSDKIGINDSELYGVPWVSYFTDTGIAFHGTYWHNDYTQPKSHGCVNMPIPAAKWLYLWADPVIQPRAKQHVSKYGTAVTVI